MDMKGKPLQRGTTQTNYFLNMARREGGIFFYQMYLLF